MVVYVTVTLRNEENNSVRFFSKENLLKQSKSFSLHFKSLVKSASILSLVF